MGKIPLIYGSVCAVVLLILGSLSPVGGSHPGLTSIRENEKGSRDDNTPPVTTISFDPAVPNGLNGWYISDVILTLNATDSESGVNRTYCSLLPPGEVYTEPILLTRDDVYYIYYFSVDNAGNVELPKSVSIKIDKTPPIMYMNYTWGGNFWYGYWISINLICYDPTSDIGRVEWYWNGALVYTAEGPGPEFLYNYTWEQGMPSYTIKAIAYNGAGLFNSAELINPFSIQNHHRFIRSLPLHHHIMNVLYGLWKSR